MTGTKGHIGAALTILLLSMAGGEATWAENASGGRSRIRFNRDIRPILSDKCFECHGPDAKARKADLRLDQERGLFAKRDGVRPIVPKRIDQSELYRRLVTDDVDDRMPPVKTDKQLSEGEIDLIRRWIEQGATWEKHWAFIPPTRPVAPPVRKQGWVRNRIDSFVLARLEAEGMKPSPEADRATLIRRLTLDLTGLPPSIDEIDAFLADTSNEAYERVVDRLLSSPRYGEHMARAWLDGARYADTNGYQYDRERTQWAWRDWVIWAYNRNLPFDQFTVEQLAGDLLPNATPNQRLATGFNRNHPITIEGGVIDEEYRTEYVVDRVVTTGQVWMGLTLLCARCHDHKYDPVSQREFYELLAFFNQVPERGLNGFAPQARIASPLLAGGDDVATQIAGLKSQLDRPTGRQDAGFQRWLKQTAASSASGWEVLKPTEMKASAGSKLTRLEDGSVLVGGANPARETYEILARSSAARITAIRLQALTHPSLPGGGPGRHTNSNFVLSEFELLASAVNDPAREEKIRFVRATADYSQKNYEIAKAIDGTAAGNNGWAVDGPTRKKPATAIFVASRPFGFAGGTRLRFRLRHEAGFATHGIGRPRLSATGDDPATLSLGGTDPQVQAILKHPSARRSSAQWQHLVEHYRQVDPARRAIADRIAELQKRKAGGAPPTLVMAEMSKPRATHVLDRGQYDQKREQVQPGVPAIFPPLPKGQKVDRLAFARWLTSRQHPLTARVAVNRYWQRLFGTGIVKTSEDFGRQSAWPSHMDLLDWLAVQFMESGWNVKEIQKLMVMSAAYRQDSRVSREAFAQDPENRLLVRGPRFRLDAEVIRDNVLFTSGLLIDRRGGPPVYPYQPKGLWLEINNRPNYSRSYPHQTDPQQLYRRSLYTYWKRTVPPPAMAIFDAPEREFCVVRRSRTNTPLQAFVLLNGPLFVEAARVLGIRMAEQGGETVEERLAHGFRLVTSRIPAKREMAVLMETYRERLAHYQRNPATAEKVLSSGPAPGGGGIDRAEQAAYATVARLLLNLSETITKS